MRYIFIFIGLFMGFSVSWGKSFVEIDHGEGVQIRSLLAHTVFTGTGKSSRHSIELAIQDFGPIHGFKVELGEPVDAMCSAEGGHVGAKQIIANSQVVGVIGTSCSGAAVAASPLISQAGLVMISPSNTSPALTSDLAGSPSPNYHPGYFRTSNNDLHQAKTLAEFAYHHLDLRRMATLDDGDPYTLGLTMAFRHEFNSLGGEVLLMVRVGKGDMDMSHILVRLAALQPDGVFFPIFNKEGIPFVRQVRSVEALKSVKLVTGAALLLREFLEVPESLGIYLAGPERISVENTNQATGKSVKEVLSTFTATYGDSPGTPYWVHAYDAATLLLKAIKSVGQVANDKLYIHRKELRREIRGIRNFRGLLGTLSCDDFGDCGTGNVSIYHHNKLGVTDPTQLEEVWPSHNLGR